MKLHLPMPRSRRPVPKQVVLFVVGLTMMLYLISGRASRSEPAWGPPQQVKGGLDKGVQEPQNPPPEVEAPLHASLAAPPSEEETVAVRPSQKIPGEVSKEEITTTIIVSASETTSTTTSTTTSSTSSAAISETTTSLSTNKSLDDAPVNHPLNSSDESSDPSSENERPVASSAKETPPSSTDVEKTSLPTSRPVQPVQVNPALPPIPSKPAKSHPLGKPSIPEPPIPSPVMVVPKNITKSFDQPDSPNAFVFYATRGNYACSVLVNIYLLRAVFHTKHRVFVLVTPGISQEYRTLFESLGAEVVQMDPPPLNPESIGYYEGCLLKLEAFRMHEIDETLKRVVILDSDQLILKNLDHLFDLPPADLLAPRAYWIDEAFMASTLMVIQPSAKLWTQIQDTIADLPPHQYDMDIVNSLFEKDAFRLPGYYVVLNSHWEDKNVPAWFAPRLGDSTDELRTSSTPATDKDLEDLYVQSYVLHFTAVGKPWTYDMASLRATKPNAHAILYQQWREWRTLALATCPAGVVRII